MPRHEKLIRPMPSDFAEKAATMGLRKLAKHYRAGDNAIHRWLAEANIPLKPTGAPRLQPPDGFTKLARKMGVAALAKQCGVSPRTIDRWLSDTGVRAHGGGRQPRPMPADFGQIYGTMARRKLITHYRTNSRALDRWIKQLLDETGRPPHVFAPPSRAAAPAPPPPPPSPIDAANTRFLQAYQRAAQRNGWIVRPLALPAQQEAA